MRGFRALAPLLLLAAAGLSACDTAEERAENHFQRGVAFLEAGETDRGLVELRNVFRLDAGHVPARLAYADALVERGAIGEAIGHYLYLVEQDWSNFEGHRRLAELALSIQDFETAVTHIERAYELDPADPETRAYKASLEFRTGARAEAVARAEGVLAERPDLLAAHMVLIADRAAAEDNEGALARIETALALAPEDEGLHLVKLSMLERRGNAAEMGAQLALMTELFPGNEPVARARAGWHLAEGDPDAAEAFVRARTEAVAAGPGRIAADLGLVGFVAQVRGTEAARAELERLAAAAADPASAHPYRRALAALDAREGRTEAAVVALRSLLEDAGDDETRRETQGALAELLIATGAREEGGALVDAVLAEDASHVGALKLRARRLIEADRPDEAIRDLRAAVNQEPRDAEALTLMALAHERAGARELAGERLALAVEVTGRAAPESLRYASFLLREGRAGAAEGVVVDALRVSPEHPDLLLALGEIHLERRDWERANQVAALLRRGSSPEAEARAATLEAAALMGQNRFAETIETIRDVAAENGDLRAAAGVVQTYLLAGDEAGARFYVEDLLGRDPGNPDIRMMQAALAVIAGEAAEAEAGYRALVADEPGYAPAHEALYVLLAQTGRAGEAAAALEAGLAATGGDPRLLFARAGALEAAGDFEGAIAVYEDLYARDSASTLIANNLASLIATHRADEESLARAFAIARRLRGTDVPHFQDTIGWILARRGEYAEAVDYLEPAAAALPGDPLVQYHLGVALHRLGRAPGARASLERALAAAGPGSDLPQMATARTLLEEIGGSEAASEAGSGTGSADGGPSGSGTGAAAPADEEAPPAPADEEAPPAPAD